MRSRVCAQGRHDMCHGTLKVDGDKYGCECECHGEQVVEQWDDFPWDAFGNFGPMVEVVGEDIALPCAMIPVVEAWSNSN